MWMNFLFSSCNEFNVFQKKHNLWYLSIKENCPKIIIVVHILILLKQKLYFYICIFIVVQIYLPQKSSYGMGIPQINGE